MDSDTELLDASDSELVDDEEYYYYSEGGDAEGSGGGESDEDLCGDGSDEVVAEREQRYVILTEEDIHKRLDDIISEVSAILSLSQESACVLLRHYKWNISKLHDEWFADEEHVRHVVGLPENGVDIPNCQKLTCGVCFEQYSASVMRSAGCAHFYCHECWEGYISSSISDGPGCLMLRCPDPSCDAMVHEEIINKLAKDGDREKYAQFVLRSYVEDNKKTKWCPAPNCNCAVEFLSDGNYDVSCNCSFGFCWKCTEEAHRPVSCETVKKWILKNSAESENMNWILANSKPCPKCKRPIEKNQGCMHMTCSPPCRFEFCWLCLSAWSDHGERTGGFYACNHYDTAKKEGVYTEAEARRKRAENSLERYMHYYERWASNQTSRQKAQSDLRMMENKNLAKLSYCLGIPETQLKFITEAWLQILECRRVLKWTYAYGYYLDDKVKSRFFEYLQGEAESGLERLHKCAEKDLQEFMNPETDGNDSSKETDGTSSSKETGEGKFSKLLRHFGEFRVKLVGLTSITSNFFENLVQALEGGLVDVRSTVHTTASSKTSSSKKPGPQSKSGKKKVARTNSDHLDDGWPCERCTFINPAPADTCEICATERYR